MGSGLEQWPGDYWGVSFFPNLLEMSLRVINLIVHILLHFPAFAEGTLGGLVDTEVRRALALPTRGLQCR